MTIRSKNIARYPVPPIEQQFSIVLSTKELVFADIETTGFCQYNDITEIGAVRVDIERGKILQKFNSFLHLKYGKKVPPKITNLTGITTEQLSNAPPMEVVLPAFQQFIGTSVLSFHNASFDWRMLQQKYALIGQQLTNEVVCSMKLFRYLHPKLPANLDCVTAYYGFPIEGHHRAYVDCKWSAACYRKMRDELSDLVKAGIAPLPTMMDTKEKPVELTEDDFKRNCMIRRISGWKQGKKSRIYVTTNFADIYYDLVDSVWNVAKKRTPANFNVELLANFILNTVSMTLGQFIDTYAPAG